MKKLIPLFLVVLVMLTGCTGKGSDDNGSSNATMPEIITQLYKGVDATAYEAIELTEENF